MKKILFFICVVLINNAVITQTWPDILKDKASLLNDDPHLNVITKQYESFVNNSSPTIASAAIKSIPINDSTEPVIDIKDTPNSRIQMLPNPNKPFYGPACNSGLPSASKMRKEVYLKLEKMLKHLDALSEFFGYKKKTVSIRVFEGLRDLKTQEELFKNKLEEIKSAQTHLTNEEAETETAKWVSPIKNNVPVHSTGAAIDIRLWSEKANDFIDLGKFGVIWGENNTAPTFSENITHTQKLNRLYLLIAATKAGLINYAYEHWHFSCGDRYAAYWQEKDVNKRTACYGAVKNND